MHLLSDEKVCCRLLAQVAGRRVVGHLLGRSEACGSGLANRIRGLRSGRACAAPPVCSRPVYVARYSFCTHSQTVSRPGSRVCTYQGGASSEQTADGVCSAGSREAPWVGNPCELAAGSPTAREGRPVEGLSRCAQDLWAREMDMRGQDLGT